MANVNQYGLGRTVPAAVKREIRSRCGFGCVICGLAYYDYEHFDPDFKDAKAHDPNGMTLLCMQCNQKRARGTLSAETVSRANANPKCKSDGFASELFDFGPEPVVVKFAGVTFIDCPILIQVCGIDLLSFSPPKDAGGPVLLSGFLADSSGAITLKIVDNEWYAGDENWDVEVSGPKITIRRGLGDIALQIRVQPPHALIVEKIEMVFEGYFLSGDEKSLRFSRDGKSWNSLQEVGVEGCDVGISFG
ncbi:MAG: HNH endonuclease [Gammaproteobacteria bacterium]